MTNIATGFLTTALLIIGLVSITNAQPPDVWNGTGISSYHAASSWVDGTPATALDDALFDQSATYTARWNNSTGDTFSRSVLVQNGNVTFLGTSTDAIHTVLNDVVVDSGSTLQIQVHNLNVGEGFDVSGDLKVEGNSIMNIFQSFSVGPSVGDNADVDIGGSETEVNVNNGTTIVGQFGNGDLLVQDGADLNISGNFRLGFQAQGFALFQDVGTNLNVNPGTGLLGQIVVGGNGFGLLDFFDGAKGTASELFVVENGILGLIGSDASLSVDRTDISGAGNTAFVNIFDGGQLISGGNDAVVGSFAGSSGMIRLGDNGSSWMVDDPIIIGSSGNGELIVENGADVDAPLGISQIGRETGGIGTVTVTGIGSTISLANLDVGLDGVGLLQILDGGLADTTDGYIGLQTSQSSVQISGNGSQWNTGSIRLGGLLSVEDGGAIISNTTDIEKGTALIEGTQSIWTVNGTLSLEPGGSEVTIDGGTMNIANDVTSSGLFADVRIESAGTLTVGGVFTNGSALQLRGNGNTIVGDVLNVGQINMPFGSTTINGTLTNNNSSNIEGILTVNGIYRGSHAMEGEGATILNGQYQIGQQSGVIGSHHWFEHDLGLAATSQTNIELEGTGDTEYDRFVVDGELGLAGTLSVQLLGDFVPQDGDEFLIAEAGTLLGTFAGLPENSTITSFGDVELKISYMAGDGNDIALFAESGVVLGDINGDGEVNLLDVSPFVELISGGQFQAEGDINGDGEVNLLDVAGFIELLAG